MDNIHGNHRISVWDKQVSTFLHSLEMSRPQALLLNALTIEVLGTWKRAIGQKRTPQQQAGRKRTLDDIKTYFAREDLTKRPDRMIFDFHHRTIYVIEEAGLVKEAVREVKAAEAFEVDKTVKGVAAGERRAALDRREGGEKGLTMRDLEPADVIRTDT